MPNNQNRYNSFRSNEDRNCAEVEDLIERDDLLTKIQAATTDGPVSLWTLFEELATPMDLRQQALLYAIEELFGRGTVELADDEHYTELVAASCPST